MISTEQRMAAHSYLTAVAGLTSSAGALQLLLDRAREVGRAARVVEPGDFGRQRECRVRVGRGSPAFPHCAPSPRGGIRRGVCRRAVTQALSSLQSAHQRGRALQARRSARQQKGSRGAGGASSSRQGDLRRDSAQEQPFPKKGSALSAFLSRRQATRARRWNARPHVFRHVQPFASLVSDV